MTREDHYVLGHSAREIKRLTLQARLIDPITRQFFSEAGVVVGMKVLDVGCGAGDVSFLLADLVGDTGMVLGVDTASTAIGEARRRANTRSLRNVTFDEGDPSEMVFQQRFDAVVGRYILMFQRNPTTMVQKLATHVRPNGLIAFHEGDWEAARSFPQAQTYDQCCRWIVDSVRSSGADPQMGLKLHSTFVGAGLSPPSMRLESVIGGAGISGRAEIGVDRVGLLLEIVAEVIRTLLPQIERLGLAAGTEIDVDTLVMRMHDEIVTRGSIIVGRSEICAWARL